MFNPTQPYLLYASFRRHPSLYCWDIRGDVSTPVKAFEPIRDASKDNPPEYQRTDSNQKRRFDIDYCGKWLSIGNKVSMTSSQSHGNSHVRRMEMFLYSIWLLKSKQRSHSNKPHVLKFPN